MGWRYKAGLFLIAAVVIIWVTSAEVTQVILTLFFSNIFPFFFCWELNCVCVLVKFVSR